jgi:hypothetical protein
MSFAASISKQNQPPSPHTFSEAGQEFERGHSSIFFLLYGNGPCCQDHNCLMGWFATFLVPSHANNPTITSCVHAYIRAVRRYYMLRANPLFYIQLCNISKGKLQLKWYSYHGISAKSVPLLHKFAGRIEKMSWLSLPYFWSFIQEWQSTF